MKILLIGYGKMGQTIERIARNRGHEISGIIDMNNQDDLEKELAEAEVAIEFTQPESAYNNIMSCIQARVPVISGTTGWLDQWDEVESAVHKNKSSLFYASNFSVGVNIFFAINERLAKLMNAYPDYEVSIEETHHTEKKDAPSGTAITIAEGIYNNIERKSNWVLDQKEPADDAVNIDAHRIGKVFGKHTVHYNSPIDEIIFTHNAHTRDGFALGAVLAAEWVLYKSPAIYDMRDMLNLK